ncbi:AI-2E family transporter [Nocardioides pantholopis]|uniref:AI-2E family transporter n=1 Tax=Nocardioides pantholopis TaxID=2483798 RepID=UPI001F1502E2|nr:AI-2E family transporter [Nocardioides pantholopis]
MTDVDDAQGDHGPRRRLRISAPPLSREEETIARRLAHQWSQLRDERRQEPTPVAIVGGRSNFSRAQVPWGLDLAAAWSWRLLVVCGAGYVLLWLLAKFAVVTVPLAIALLLAALATPAVRGLRRAGIPHGMSAFVVEIAAIGLMVLMVTFVSQQVAEESSKLADQVVKGLDEIRVWLREGPLNASESQINSYIGQVQQAISTWSKNGGAYSQVTELGTALTHVVTGLFIVLFSTYFFLADGARIWAFFVRIAPRAARERVDSSGRVAWVSLTQFVRATVLVALVDAIGIAVWAAVLGVPLVLAIGVLVFIGAFVPMVGATVAGAVAVLVALVDQGPWTALLMLVGVIVVQQVEGHVLQPFLMGRFVSVHPLAVLVAIACGVIVAGVAGALVAVPLVAAGNAVVMHLASRADPGDDPAEELAGDYARDGTRPEPVHDPDRPALADEPRSPAETAEDPEEGR